MHLQIILITLFLQLTYNKQQIDGEIDDVLSLGNLRDLRLKHLIG